MLGPAGAQPTPIFALVVAGMNDVLNSQGYTQAAWWNQIPIANAAPRNGPGGREHDADDEACFNHLTKYDQQRGEHDGVCSYSAMTTPWAVSA